MRLNKYLAQALGISRRSADDLIKAGKIFINNQPTSLGQQVEDGDSVTYEGKTLSPKKFEYVLLNKPLGYVCSRKQQDEKPTIYQLLPNEFQHLQVAGRLDHDSSGLLLLTNDGDYAQKMTHPKYAKEKKYQIELDKQLTKNHRAKIEIGVDIEDGTSLLGLEGAGKKWQVTMREGRNRQIRRTFEALGYKVEKLNRTQFGPYKLALIGDMLYNKVDRID